ADYQDPGATPERRDHQEGGPPPRRRPPRRSLREDPHVPRRQPLLSALRPGPAVAVAAPRGRELPPVVPPHRRGPRPAPDPRRRLPARLAGLHPARGRLLRLVPVRPRREDGAAG